MKHLRKKFLAAILCLTMVVSLLPQSMVYAAESTEAVQDYQIYPTPHEVAYQDGDFIIRSEVNVVYESDIDDVTKDRMSAVLETKNKNVTVSDEKQDGKTNVLVGVYGSGEYVDTYAAENYEIDEELFDHYASHYVISSNDEIVILGLDTDAAFYGVTTLKHIFHQMEGSTIRNFTIKDYADVNIRGFIEGYYGLPWSNENRMSLMEFGGEFKMTSYIFAPKDDVYHTSKWRDLYPEEEIAKIKEMAELGNSVKCRFVWTAHPFMGGFNSNDVEGEIEALLAKFDQLYDAGVRQFGVLGDDVGSLNKDIVIRVMNAVSEWAKEKGDVYDSVFCPAGYNHSWQGDYSELNTYDAGFPDDVQIFWTGEAVCQPVIQQTLNHFRNQNAVNGERRAPLFWLNWPVNDINHSRMLMGKGSLLHTDINVDDLAGIVTNPMQEAQPSKVAIFAVADYAWNVADFDDDQSWADSFAYIDADASEELHTLAKHMSNPQPNGHGLVLAESEELQPLIAEFERKLAAGESLLETGAQLAAEMDVIISACKDFHVNSKNETMKEELLPFTNSLGELATAIKNYTLAAMALEEGNGTEAFEYYSVGSENHASCGTHKKAAKNGPEIVDPGSTYLIPLAEKIQDAIADEITAYAMGDGYEERLELTASSNITDWYEGPVDNIVDGNPGTSAWQNGYESVGSYYQVDLSEPSTVYGVDILNGSAAGGKERDTFKSAKLQYTTDGTNWMDVANGATTEEYQERFVVSGVKLENVVALRYVCTVAGSKWPAMREFTVNTTEAEEVEFTAEVIRTTEGWAYYENSDAALIDGNKESYVWYKVRQGAAENGDTALPGDYVGVKLSQPITLGKINILQGKNNSDGDYFKKATLQYSLDGTAWTDVETYTDAHEISVDLSAEEITAQYVRLVNQANSGWVAFREFEVQAKKVAEGMAYTNAEAYADAETTADFDTFTLEAMDGLSLAKDQYIGLKLDRIHELLNLDVAVSAEGLTLQISENSVEWTNVEAGAVSGNARYIRLVNNTDNAVAFDLEKLIVTTAEAVEKSLESTNYSSIEGDFTRLFDGDWTTASQFANSQIAGKYITIDLGSEIELNSFKAVCTDSEWDYARHGKFSVSLDNENWTEIMTLGSQDSANEGEAENTDEIGDVLPDHEISFNTKSVTGLDLTARYLKFEITRTKVGADKWVRFQEFEINGGAYIPVVNDPTVEGAAEDHGNFHSALTDNNLSTVYTFDSEIVYHESNEDEFNVVKVIQNGISNAEILVRFANDELYTPVGILSQTINEFAVEGDILDVKIVAKDSPAAIAEVILYAKEMPSADKTVLAELLDAEENTADWTTETAALYEAAYAAAEEMNENEYATQATVDAMAQQLQKAVDAKALKGDKEAVEKEIEELDGTLYTSATFKAYEKAVNAASQALEDADNMSAEDAEVLVANIKAAKEVLRYNPTKYEEASLYAEECTALDEDDYEAAAFAAFAEALASLQEMLNEGSQAYSPAEFEEAKAAVEAKEDALMAPGGSEKVTEIFEDVTEGKWYVSYVQYVYDNGLMAGNNGLFNPTKNVTRAQLVTTLYRMEGEPEVTDRKALTDFTDVADGLYYTDAVCWAYNIGVGTGNDGKFNPTGNLTRQQMAAFLYRYAEVAGLDTAETGDYSDMINADKVSAYAEKAVSWAVGTGLISGSEVTNADGSVSYDLNPRGNTTRAQLAAILQRFCEK